jgi:hypothetical protein
MSEGTWLGRYRRVLPIRARDSFHLLSAETDDGPSVVVVASPHAEAAQARRRLEAFAAAHSDIRHPAVPRTRRAEVVDGTFVVELACDAALDGEELLRVRSDVAARIPYAIADGHITYLRQVLQVAHAAGYCLGRICYANMLFSLDGRAYLVGFGYNVVALRETGTVVGSSTVFQAPEVVAGADPSPIGDYVALLALMRSLTTHVEMLDALVRVMRGVVEARDFEVLRHLRWFETHVYAALPQERATIEEATAVAARIRELLGVTLDQSERDTYFRDLIARADAGTPVESGARRTHELVVASDGSWFLGLDGVKRQLGPRRALRRVFSALVEKRLREPGRTLSVWDVLAAGWPGEEPIYEAALNRVYVTIARLRGLGLSEVVERYDDGYRISPELEVRVR